MKIVVWSELASGGIADYAHCQANALVDRGIEVEMLCTPAFLAMRKCKYHARPILRDLRPSNDFSKRWVRALKIGHGLLWNARIAARAIREIRPDAVLTHFSEYMAPLWAWHFRRLRAESISFYTILHDPLRNHVVGPLRWHHWSVEQAYSFMDGAFVHHQDCVEIPPGIDVTLVPHGSYPFPKPQRGEAQTRNDLGIPADATLLLSFGYIRNDKNLDLVLEALTAFPEVHLLVAGSNQEGGNKQVSYYRSLAEQLGVAERCHWITRFIDEAEAADLFAASDLAISTYSHSFVSASGVQAIASNYRLPLLLSSGSASVKAIVDDFGTGIWVEPDRVEAIQNGLRRWLAEELNPDWVRYEAEYSWARNAAIIERTISAGLTKQEEKNG